MSPLVAYLIGVATLPALLGAVYLLDWLNEYRQEHWFAFGHLRNEKAFQRYVWGKGRKTVAVRIRGDYFLMFNVRLLRWVLNLRSPKGKP